MRRKRPDYRIKHWALMRAAVFIRDGFRCVRCGESAEIDPNYNGRYAVPTVNRGVLSVDHVISLARGGTNTIENMQTLCRQCNCLKAGREDKVA